MRGIQDEEENEGRGEKRKQRRDEKWMMQKNNKNQIGYEQKDRGKRAKQRRR